MQNLAGLPRTVSICDACPTAASKTLANFSETSFHLMDAPLLPMDIALRFPTLASRSCRRTEGALRTTSFPAEEERKSAASYQGEIPGTVGRHKNTSANFALSEIR